MPDQPAHEPALDDRGDHTDIHEEVGNSFAAESQHAFGEQREERIHDREGQRLEQNDTVGSDQAAPLDLPLLFDDWPVVPRFREQRERNDAIETGKCGGEIARRGVPDGTGDAGEGGSHDERQAESGPDETHHVGSPFRWRPVRQRCLGHADRSPGSSGNDAGHQQQRETSGPGKQQVGKTAADQPYEHHRPSTDAVAQPSPPWRQE